MKLSELPEVITPVQMAKATNMSEVTVRRKCQRGELPAVKVGRKWLISRDKALGALL